MFAFDLLHRQLAHRVLLEREMPLIDARLVGVIPSDAKGGEQGAQFQKLRILSGADDIREHSPRVMIKCLPEPPLSSFGPNETPHFIHFGRAPWSAAHGVGAWLRKREQ